MDYNVIWGIFTSLFLLFFVGRFVTGTDIMFEWGQCVTNETTSCCRALGLNTYYGSIVQYIPGNAREQNVYMLGLDSAPSTSVVMKINASRIDCNT